MNHFPEPAMPIRTDRSAGGVQQLLILSIVVAALAGCASESGPPPRSTPAPSSASGPVVSGTPESAAAPAAKGDANQRFQDALALMKDHKTDEAQAALEALVQDFPNLSGPQTDLGILYARTKQRDKAFNSFNKAIAANPKNAAAYDWTGILYRESGDYANAEHSYLKAVAAQPDYAGAHLNLGILYDVYLKRPQDALTQYREYQRIAGTDKVIVTAWIDELQPPATADAPAGAESKP